MANSIDVDNCVKSFYEKIDSKSKAAIVSAMAFGMLAHGMMLFNKYSMHDDICMIFGVGTTYPLGRWFLGLLSEFSKYFFHATNYSLPLIKGLTSIAFIAISSVLVIKTLRVKYAVTSALIAAIMVVFPTWAATFGYMFTSSYYAFALLLSSLGVFIVCNFHKNRQMLRCLVASLIIACSIGIYQAFIPYTLTLMLFYLIGEIYSTENNRSILFKGMYLVGTVIVSIILYFALTKLSLLYTGCELTSYQNANSMGREGIAVYFERIFTAFRYFWHPKMRNLMYPMNTVPLYYASIVCCVVLFFCKLMVLFRNREFIRATMLSFLLICIPIAVNFIAIMCSFKTIHHLMCYGQVMPFVLLAWMIEKTPFDNVAWNRFAYITGSATLALISLTYCRFDNVYYLKYCFAQNQLVNYYNTMITRMKSSKGYKAEYPITFVGDSFCDASAHAMSEFLCEMPPLGGMMHPHIYSMSSIMKFWCGYSPCIIESKAFENLPEVKAMSIYPNDGSIKVVNNTVVVKIDDPLKRRGLQ